MNTLKLWIEKDLTDLARAGKLPAAHGVNDYVQALIEQLVAGRHPIITGDAGVGKTAIVHELVRRVVRGAGPERLARRQIVEISLQRRLGSLDSRYKMHGELQQLAEALRRMRRPPVLFVRDFDMVNHCNLEDAFASLVYGTEAVIIGEGSDVTVADLLEYEAHLQQAFARVPVDEPTLERAELMLRGWAEEPAHQHARRFTDDAVEQALSLTYRFMPRLCLPRKAVDLLSQSAGQVARGEAVSADAVLARFCALHRIPRVLVDARVPLDLERVRRKFAGAVFGQDTAIEAIVDTVAMLKAGLSDLRRPLAAILLVGPTGVGKTYIAQLLAELLFGDRDRIVRINMADFKADGDASRLFGDAEKRHTSSDANVGRGLLATRLAGYPFGVVLLDEFEKANPVIHDHLLQLIDEGVFVNGEGETVSCRSLIFVATSNAGYEHNTPARFGFAHDGVNGAGGAIPSRLEAYFRFELLNRFDRIIHFAPLKACDARSIVTAELRRIGRRAGMRQRQLALEVEPAVVDAVVRCGFDEERGARYLRHTFEQLVTTALARFLASESPPSGSRVRLTWSNGAVRAVRVRCEAQTTNEREPLSGISQANAQAKDRARRIPLPLSWRKRSQSVR